MVILIVDDDQEDAEFFTEAVNEVDRSVKCWVAKDGKEALHLLSKELVLPPDYVFLDINMPIMNGRETLAAIKASTRLRDIPVIMYSTTTDTKEIKSFYDMGAYDFLIKPRNFRKLVEALESIIVSTKKKIR